MKKKSLQFIVLGILLLVALMLVLTNNKGTLKKELRDFAVEDTALIDKIILKDKANNQVTLEKKQGYWALNHSAVARQELVNGLLETLFRIRVKDPVSKVAQDNVIKDLEAESTKVEVFVKGKLAKVFYVGGPAKETNGTYMMQENSLSPFIMEIPGLRVSLTNQFYAKEDAWKSKIVFNYPIQELAEIKVEIPSNQNQSFRVTHNGNRFALFRLDDNQPIDDFDLERMRKFFLEFQGKSFSKFADDLPVKSQDSIRTSVPMYFISVKTNGGEQKWIKVFGKDAGSRKNMFGDDLAYDPDTFYMEISSRDFVYAKYYDFDPIFKTLESFLKE